MSPERLSQQFQRSTRIDRDYGDGALEGFLLHETGASIVDHLLQQIARSRQRAFTWTGTYGTGKSTLALYLSCLLGPDDALRQDARQHLSDDRLEQWEATLPKIEHPWLIVPVVGHKASPVEVLAAALRESVQQRDDLVLPEVLDEEAPTAQALLRAFEAVIDQLQTNGEGGLLLVADELGKFLEHANETDGDIHVFQDIAELFGDYYVPAVFLGILHQAFQEYSGRLDRQRRNEWAKIQGRFADIPFAIKLEESISLVSEAIGTADPEGQTEALASAILGEMKGERFAQNARLIDYLAQCEPLHPVTTLLLPAIARQRFGQNQRSTFSFLASAEPFGFQDYLSGTNGDSPSLYTPDLLWDYLEANLEPVILSSPLGHQWAEAAAALQRAAHLDDIDQRLLKTISVVDLFGRVYGLYATEGILQQALPDLSNEDVDDGLQRLRDASCIVFRRHLGAWVTFAGSDVDVDQEIDNAVRQVSGDESRIVAALPHPQPIVAKRHYHATGTLRWFDVRLASADGVNDAIQAVRESGADGAFIALIGDRQTIETRAETSLYELADEAEIPIVVGTIPMSSRLVEVATEYAALQDVKASLAELQSDDVARKEIHGRLDHYRGQLDAHLDAALDDVDWFYRGAGLTIDPDQTLSIVASEIADEVYHATPTLKNELVNRHQPSSNAVAAKRALLNLMIATPHRADLGIEKHPPELGLYRSLLFANGLHQLDEDQAQWAFVPPDDDSSLRPIWAATDAWLEHSFTEGPVSLATLYDDWARPPYGMRPGVMSIVALAFLLSRSHEVAFYVDDRFTPTLDDFFIDRMLKDPSAVAVRLISMTGVRREVLKRLTDFMSEEMNASGVETALDAAKQLAQFAYRLPPWVKRTRQLSDETKRIRDVLLKADDPHALLFEDLPHACGIEKNLDEANIDDFIQHIESAYNELSTAYDQMLDGLKQHTLQAFGYPTASASHIGALKRRAEALTNKTGDMTLESFIVRLTSRSLDQTGLESLASFVTHKPVREWHDQDVLKAKREIGNLADRFGRVERFYQRHGDPSEESNLRAISLMVLDADNRMTEHDLSLDLSPDVAETIDAEASEVLGSLEDFGLGEKGKAAVLIRAAQKLMEQNETTPDEEPEE